jgi:hypothetical protein
MKQGQAAYVLFGTPSLDTAATVPGGPRVEVAMIA